LKALEQDDLQLLWDVDVCWLSTLLMVECAILLRAVSISCTRTFWYLILTTDYWLLRSSWLWKTWKSSVNTDSARVSGTC
jgi:hypothetical protein